MSKGNMLMNTASGKLGSMVLYRAGGEQRTRTYVKTVKNPKTYSQIAQRSQLANLVSLYRTLRVVLDKGFSDKKSKQSDYNAFVSRNLNRVKIYFTKEEAAGQACVVAPYQITSGPIAEIKITGIADDAVTNLFVGTSFVVDENTTIGQLSTALVNNNVDIVEGMALSYVSVVQHGAGIGIPPTVTANYYKMTIDTKSERLVLNTLPAQAIAIVGGYIGHGEHIATGGFAWILSGKDETGKLQVSPQTLIINDDETYTYYGSREQMDAAIASYGGQPDAFLTPGQQSTTQGPALATVASVTVAGKLFSTNTSRITAAAGAPIVIAGTNLQAAAMSIALSSKTTAMTAAEITAAAKPLSEVLTGVTGNEVQVSGTMTAAASNILQIVITQDGRVLYQFVILEETPDPAG